LSPGIARASENAEPQECVIRMGGGGKTSEYTARLRPGEVKQVADTRNSDFVRSTSGPCHFHVFNGDGMTGRAVTLGSNIDERIRVGIDGVVNRDDGGGATWKIRSLRIEGANPVCKLRIGGNGMRMDYFTGNHEIVPAIDRIESLTGHDCRANVWNKTSFGKDDDDNQFKAILARRDGPTYDPGFRVRSMRIWTDGSACLPYTQQEGRCLPQVNLERSVYIRSRAEDAQLDRDEDDLVDELENKLAHAFRPIYVNHSTEDATRKGVYRTAGGASVIEPVTIFQVRKGSEPNTIELLFMKLWARDKYDSNIGCGGHAGDSQRNRVVLRTTGPGKAGHGTHWWVKETSGGIKSELAWNQDTPQIRGAHFERAPGESGIANHLVIYLSKGKHHEYADGGWSGQDDKEWGVSETLCNLTK
jgi:hypothetical protein